MNIFTDEQKKEFLKKLTKEYYNQGDDYYAYQTKRGDWEFGYSNDYPMQHGDGKRMRLPNSMVEVLMSHYVS
jgi:hypothetical protein